MVSGDDSALYEKSKVSKEYCYAWPELLIG